jgi:sigma-B regulation protein RsbU (phosphoserine phosphatase)
MRMNDPAPLFSLRFTAIPANLKMVRCVVEAASCQAGCAEALCNHVVIAVNEACMNIIQHGYSSDPAGEIELEFRNNGGVLEFILQDQAPTAVIEDVRPRDLDDLRPGGLGTHFIREIMDEFSHVPGKGGHGNRWRLTKTISHSE